MSLRAKSHSDLSAAAASSPLAGGRLKSFSVSSSGVNRGVRLLNGTAEEEEEGGGRGLPRPARRPLARPSRPVRAVRPLSAAVSSSGSFFQINHLHGELVRKRKECEDLRKENKLLTNEIHMERVMLRTESELTMRNLRNLNQELQVQVKELKQKLYLGHQRATLCSRAADEAEECRGQAERSRVLAEVRAAGRQRDQEAAEAERDRLREELQQLREELQQLREELQQLREELQQLNKERADLQRSLAQAERVHFESKLQLDRVSGENRALLQENRSLGSNGDDLRLKLGRITEENVQNKQSEATWRRRAAAAEEEADRAGRARREAEARRRLAEEERRERTAESLGWREKHRELADRVRGHEDLKALRQSKACQANIKSFFLCVTESDQRVRILRSRDGTTRNFTEGDPVYIAGPEPGTEPGPEPGPGPEEPERSSSRTSFRACAPLGGAPLGAPLGAPGPSLFHELPAFRGERPESAPPRRSRTVVEYFWIPTDHE